MAVCVLPPVAAADALDTISAYAGTWQLHVDHLKTEFSRERSEDMTIVNRCWRSTDYYACNQIVNGASAALIVFTYSAKTKQYATTTIVPEAEPHAGTLIVDGATWTFPWQDTDEKGNVVYLRVVNTFSAPGTIEYRQEFSRDRQHWTVDARGHETKQP